MSGLIEWESMCVVCLRKGENRFIFGEDNDSNVIADKIMKCADIMIKKDINQPQNICLQCLNDLNVAYKFRQMCEQSNSIIKALLNTNHQEFKIQELWRKTPTIVNPIPDVYIKEEILDNPAVDDKTCDNESTPMDLEEDPHTKAKFVAAVKNDPDSEAKFATEDRTNTGVHSNTVQLNNVKASKINKTKNEMNSEILRRPRGRLKISTEESCTKPSLKSAHKKPLKVCEICNHSFRFQYALDTHMRRHNNERPFNCDNCDKAFVTAADLRRHVRVHTGQKPFKCHYCDRGFSDYSVRKNHESKHTGERPYKCPTCGNRFASAKGLTEHLQIHSSVNRFMCKECGKGFGRKVPFEKHLADHLARGDLDKSTEHNQKKWLEKEIFKIEENASSNEITIKHEVEFVEEETIDSTSTSHINGLVSSEKGYLATSL